MGDSAMRTRLGMTIKVSKRSSTTLSKGMATGGCSSTTSSTSSTKSTSVRYSHRRGLNTPCMESGLAILQEVLIQLKTKTKEIMMEAVVPNKTQMINGSTILNIESV